MNILLVVVAVFLVLNSWIGMKRGLIKTIFSMFSFIVTILLAALISPIVSKTLQENENVTAYFSNKVNDMLPFEEVASKTELEAKKGKQTEFLKNLPLPEEIIKSLEENNSVDYYITLGVNTFEDYLCHYITNVIINAIAFIVTFLALFILLKALCISLDLVSRLPVLNQINHLLGLAAGFAYAMLIVWLGCILLTAFGSTELGSSLMKMVSESSFLSFIYNHNLFLGKMIV